MAPSWKPKKVGLKRMDAAIDALRPMGYSPDFIRKKVNELLDVYGDEGWTFIEEGSYSLLIEYILGDDNVGHGEPGESSSKLQLKDLPDENGDEQAIVEAEPSEAVSSPEIIKPLCSIEDVGPSHKAIEPLCSIEDAGPSHKAIKALCAIEDAGSSQEPIEPVCSVDAAAAAALLSPFTGLDNYCLPVFYPPSKRKPCLGWIGPKMDEDFVLLQPASVQGWMIGERRRKRKSRWDVTP